jgi:AcrR family transcriptional regulator
MKITNSANVTLRRETPLSRALNGSDEPIAPTPLDAYKLARRAFLASERVDMTTIAERLGISRVTLYRWVGNRATLLGEVMADLAIRTARAERSRIDATGADAIAHVASHLVQTLMSFEPMQHLLRAEPEFALRVLTTAEGPTAARIAEYWTEEIDTEIAAGHFTPVLSAPDLAYLIVRLSESFVYKEVIAGDPADPALAERVFRMILRSAEPD